MVLPFSEFAYNGPHLRFPTSVYRYEWIIVETRGGNSKIAWIKPPITFGP